MGAKGPTTPATLFHPFDRTHLPGGFRPSAAPPGLVAAEPGEAAAAQGPTARRAPLMDGSGTPGPYL